MVKLPDFSFGPGLYGPGLYGPGIPRKAETQTSKRKLQNTKSWNVKAKRETQNAKRKTYGFETHLQNVLQNVTVTNVQNVKT